MNLEIFLNPPALQIAVADTVTSANGVKLILSATSLGFPVVTPRAEWTSADPRVAIVDSTGFVQVVGLGLTTITARVNSEKATTQLSVVRRVVQATLTPTTFQGLVGDTAMVSATALDPQGLAVGGTTFAFASSDPTSASVVRTGNQTAKITLLKAGAATVSVVAGGQTAATAVTSFTRDFSGSIATNAPAGALVFSAGDDATCGIIALGRGFCFGKAPPVGIAKDTSCFNDQSPGLVSCTLVPLRIAGSLSFTSVSVGDSVACGVTSGNQAYCWGLQTYGQLGNGVASTGTSAQPNLVVGAVSRSAVLLARVSAGRNHACGITPGGSVLCWGRDSAFQLGTGDGLPVNSTTPIPIKSSLTFSQISAGGDHTCALTANGTTVCWGDNSRGQIGNGTPGGAVDTPATISGAFAQVSAGGAHTCALNASGAAFCWGANDLGQLGIGTQIDSPSPTAVSGGLTFKSISAGRFTTCGVTTGGAAFCWGNNAYGQVGNGSSGTAPLLVPTAVSGGHTDFVAVTAGVRHACALAVTGAFCWGSNLLGALGNEFQAMVQPTPTKTATPQ